MSHETQTDHPGILHELRQIRRMQEELRSRLDRIETALHTLPELKIRMEYLPQSIAEQLQGLLPGEGISVSQAQHLPEEVHTPYQPERKDSWSWKEHILYTLFQQARPLLAAELVDILHGLGVRGKKDRRLVVKDVSKNLTALVKVGRLVKFKPEGAGKFFYCLPGWMDGEGELRSEYWGRGAFM
jgi:hypothetical protein